MSASVHPTASRGYSAGGDDYERSRPAYPGEALDVLRNELRLGANSVVVELGAGTGKFTRMLAPSVRLLVAAEPVEAMRAQLTAAVTTPVVAATAEAVPLAPGCADAVVAATAFHWFRGEEALAEIHRVLRSDGGLGLLWNNPDREWDWVHRVWAIVDEHRGATPGNRDLQWQEPFARAAGFTPLAHRRFGHSVDVDLDALIARVASISFIAALSPVERDAVLERVRAVAAAHPDLTGRPSFKLPYRTDLYWCHKR